MGKVAANKTRLYIAQYRFDGYLTSAEMKAMNELDDATALSDKGPRRVVDNYDHNLALGGFFDGASGAIDTALASLLGSGDDQYATLWPNSDSLGDVVFEMVVRLSQDSRTVKRKQAILLDALLEGANAIGRGSLLTNPDDLPGGTPHKIITGVGAETGVNMGATTAGQTFAVVVRIVSVSGAGSITIDTQESQNDGSPDAYANISGLSVTATAVGITRVTTTAATEAWKRINVSAFSGFTNVGLLVTAAKMQ